MKVKNAKFVALSMALIALTGCGRTLEKFDCPYGKGVGCRSITEVNQMVNEESVKGLEEGTLPPSVAASSYSLKGSINGSKIQRVSEEHLRVWLAPFQDEQGDFHEASIIHTVLKPGYWQISESL